METVGTGRENVAEERTGETSDWEIANARISMP